MNNTLIPKSFWERKEGMFGMAITASIVMGLGYIAMYLLPFIIVMLTNTIQTIFLAGILLTIFALVTNGTIQNVVWNLFKSFTRGVASLFVTVDPVGIVKNYIFDLKEKRYEMNDNIKDLKVHARKLDQTIQVNKAEIVTTLKLAQKAKSDKNEGEFRLRTRKAGRREKSVNTLNELYDKMNYLLRILEKIYMNSGYKIEDLEDEVNIKVAEFNASKGARSAISSAMYLLKGDLKREEMFEMSMDYMADQVGLMLGELDDMMFVTNEISSSIDLENGLYEDKGFDMLSQWEQKADALFITKQEFLNLKGI